MELEVASQTAKWNLVAGTGTSETSDLDKRAWYLEQLSTFFSDNDLRTICFELGVDYDDLPASGAHGKARELMVWLSNRKKLERLYAIVKRERPHLFE